MKVIDQWNDQIEKSKKNRYVVPHPDDGRTINGEPTLVSTGTGSACESLSDDAILGRMKHNLDYIRNHANDIFHNLKVWCEYDSESQLIHMIIIFKRDFDQSRKGDDNLYPYPLDITIPKNDSVSIVYNSKNSIDVPDYSTEVVDEKSKFNISNWIEDESDQALSLVLLGELQDFDLALGD